VYTALVKRLFALVALGSLAALACGSSATSAPSDAGKGALGTCTTFTDGVIAVDPNGPDTQVHAASAFAGDRVYVVYDRPKGADPKKLDVFLAAFRCDGKPAFAPVRVSDDDGNDVDPEIAVRGDRLVVAWAADSGAAQDNLSLHLRAFDRDGTPRGGSRIFTGPRSGKPVTGNAWMAQVAPTAGGFALAAAWGVPEAPAFQAFFARLDPEGAPLGEAIDLGFDATTTQTVPDVVGVPGAAFAAFQREPNQGDGAEVLVVRVDDGASTVTKVGSVPDVLSPSLAADGANVWLAAGTSSGAAKLWHVSATGASPVDASGFGAPAIALAKVGGAIVGTTMDAGHRQLKVARFDDAGVLTNELVVVSDVPPYPIELTTVDPAGVFFLAYQEGTSPAFRAKGRFLDLR
jgi:hypothetical protein